MADHRIERLRENIQSVYLGNRKAVDLLLTALLARGHILIEDVPGVGKTVLARSLAKSVDCRFSRVQLTPDLLPTDLLGISIYNSQTQTFDFKPGPIFANFVLADEINRTTPRTQSALLEAMSEEQVSVDNTTYALKRPFMVIATQNPFEFEGTYYLPENQLDRFLLRVGVGYPDRETERQVLVTRPGRNALDNLKPVLTGDDIIALQDETPKVKIAGSIMDYILDVVQATRNDPQLHLGISPRGALALTQAAQAAALLAGREYVTPDDVKSLVIPVCAHRVIGKSYLNGGDTVATARILEQIMARVASPA